MAPQRGLVGGRRRARGTATVRSMRATVVACWTRAQQRVRGADGAALPRRPAPSDHRRDARRRPPPRARRDHRPRRRRRDGHVERADPSLLRLDGRGAGGGVRTGRRRRSRPRPRADRRPRPTRPPNSRRSSQSYAPAQSDWTMQLWLDAWSEAARRPALQQVSRGLNREWQAHGQRRSSTDGVDTRACSERRPRWPRVAAAVDARRAGAAGRRPRRADQPQRRAAGRRRPPPASLGIAASLPPRRHPRRSLPSVST